MDALSREWQEGITYSEGDRVAFKVGDFPGAEAFECITGHLSSTENQPDPNDNTWWQHYPRGFPCNSTLIVSQLHDIPQLHDTPQLHDPLE